MEFDTLSPPPHTTVKCFILAGKALINNRIIAYGISPYYKYPHMNYCLGYQHLLLTNILLEDTALDDLKGQSIAKMKVDISLPPLKEIELNAALWIRGGNS